MSSWTSKTVRDITDLIKDGTHGTHKEFVGGIPLLSAKDISKGKVIFDNNPRLISQSDFDAIHKGYKLSDGDILLTIVGSLGRVAQVSTYHDDYTLQRSVAILRFKKDVESRYMYHVLTEYEFQKALKRRESKGAQGGVYLGEIAKIKLNLPSKPEQRRIVAILETWDNYLELLDKKIALKRRLKKGLMQQLLTSKIRLPGFAGKWGEIQIGDIGQVRTSSVDKLTSKDEKPARLLNYMDVYRRDYITANDPFQNITAKANQFTSSDLKQGDVLFTPSSETPIDIGHSAVVTEDLPNVLFSYHLIRLRPTAVKLHYTYSAYCFKSAAFYLGLWKKAQGATRFTLSKEALSSSRITIPIDIGEQKAIAQILRTSDEELEQLVRQRKAIASQKKYLLKNLITGIIRTPENLERLEAQHA